MGQEENIKEEKVDVTLEEEEKESIGEVVEHPDEGELRVVRRDPSSFQTNEEPNDDTPHSKDEKVIILTSYPLSKFPRGTHKRALDNSTSFLLTIDLLLKFLAMN